MSNTDTLVQRLKLIQQLIQLGETDVLPVQAERLRSMNGPDALGPLADDLAASRYSDALQRIDDLLSDTAGLERYVDPRLSALRLEAEALERQLADLESEKAEIEREIRTFTLRYQQELGPVLSEILQLRADAKRRDAEKRPDDEQAQDAYEEAQQEYSSYNETVEEAQAEERIDLTGEEQSELKRLYRTASKRCHPDAVNDAHADEAQAVFIELQERYERNDLPAVRRIAAQLEDGTFGRRSASLHDVDRLEAQVKRLRQQIEAVEREVEELRTSGEYEEVTAIDDWESYFTDRKERLQAELERLQNDTSTEPASTTP